MKRKIWHGEIVDKDSGLKRGGCALAYDTRGKKKSISKEIKSVLTHIEEGELISKDEVAPLFRLLRWKI